MARHERNERRDVLAGLSIDDAHAKVNRLAEAGIRATVFSPGSIVSNLFPTTDDGVQIIVAPEQRDEALRVLAEMRAEVQAEMDRDADPAPER